MPRVSQDQLDARRQEILGAARACFARHGYEGATVRRLEGCNATILRKRSMEALEDVPDGSLDFVYVDADHTFDAVMMDIICWARKVRPGGIVAGHDYYRFRRAGVVPAVDAYTAAHGITRWFLTDYLKDRTPSWFWLREAEEWLT